MNKRIHFLALLLLLVTFTVTTSFAQFDLGSGLDEEDLVSINPKFSYDKVESGHAYDAALIVNVSPGWHINSDKPLKDFLIPAKLEAGQIDGITISDIRFPEPHTVQLLGEPMSVYERTVTVFFKVNLGELMEDGDYKIPLEFSYQPCNDRECRAPNSVTANLNITVGPGGQAINSELFTASSTVVEQVTEKTDVTTAPEEQSEIEKLISQYGFWGYLMALGIAFITGLLLSFSPCTYPMVPITVSIFAGQQRSIGRGFILSLFYVGTMAVVYGLMGAIVSLVGGVFGAWLANPVVVVAIAIVFVIFSLSMFGLYNLDVPMSIRNKLGTAKTGGGVGGAILLGVIAALVVSPCVGPFVAGILLYIATFGSPIFGFLVLFVFAIGLGTLYILIGTFSSAISKLPGAGEWMESVKKFFGFVLLLMAVYFLRTIIPMPVIVIVTGLLLLILAVFGGGFDRLTPESGMFLRLKKLIGLLAFIIGLYLIVGSMFMNGFILPPMGSFGGGAGLMQTEKEMVEWHRDLESGLAKAQAENKPVLIDTWATWCANCKVLDEKTFGNAEVANELKRFVPLKIQLEKSDSEETKAFMKKFGLKSYSLPTVLLLDQNGSVKKVLVGVTSPEDMLAELRKL